MPFVRQSARGTAGGTHALADDRALASSRRPVDGARAARACRRHRCSRPRRRGTGPFRSEHARRERSGGGRLPARLAARDHPGGPARHRRRGGRRDPSVQGRGPPLGSLPGSAPPGMGRAARRSGPGPAAWPAAAIASTGPPARWRASSRRHAAPSTAPRAGHRLGCERGREPPRLGA
jgi:hypothetical protein